MKTLIVFIIALAVNQPFPMDVSQTVNSSVETTLTLNCESDFLVPETRELESFFLNKNPDPGPYIPEATLCVTVVGGGSYCHHFSSVSAACNHYEACVAFSHDGYTDWSMDGGHIGICFQ